MCRFVHILAFSLIFSSVLWAHPVTAKGTFAFESYNQPDMQDWAFIYSFARNLSIGVDLFHDTMEPQERFFALPRLSWLVHRWNEKESQANLYLYMGAGEAWNSNHSAAAGEGGIEADYETRENYFSALARVVGAKGFETQATYQLRAGFAPYVGEADTLHSWLIAQVQYLPFAPQENVRLGPVLRMFYRNVLWEVGTTVHGTWNLNFMVHW